MYDTIIRGGTLIDGSGAPGFSSDIAVKNGRIAEIGRVAAAARETIDADGAIVTPGFIDVHTHYDGQLLWDDRIDPSFSHGVTTAIAGNCGVGFAPVNEHRRELMELMEGVEDIPGIVLDEGLDWSWRSFPDYLDKLAARSFSMDVASHITHAPLRVFVMGERALRHETATQEDIESMCRLVREAMRAGAVGFSNGRLLEHKSSKGAFVPGTFAENAELLSIAAALGESRCGVFQFIPKGAIGSAVLPQIGREARLEEHCLIESIARASCGPVTYSLMQFADDPEDCEAMLQESLRASGEGLRIRPQIAARPVSDLYTLDGYHMFLLKPSYLALEHLPRKERAKAMRDPVVRARILSEANVAQYLGSYKTIGMVARQQMAFREQFIIEGPLDFEPLADRKISALAAKAGKTPEELVYDHYCAGDGENYTIGLGLNYARGSLDHVRGLLDNPAVISGLADGGAHMRLISDASMPTFQLAFWTRDRKRGPCLPIETIVRKMTSEPADLYSLKDRGALKVGQRADLNVIDYDNIRPQEPRVVHDLPSGAGRLLQGSSGYLATLVAGTVTRRNDCDTGARPGRLIRAAH